MKTSARQVEDFRDSARDLGLRKLRKREYEVKYGSAEDAIFDDVIPFGNPGERQSRHFLKLDSASVAALDQILENFGARAILASLVMLLDSRSGTEQEPGTASFDDWIEGESTTAKADVIERAALELQE